MLRRIVWISLLLMASPVWAVTSGLGVLPTGATDNKSYGAKFAIGLTVDGGMSWQSSANLNQKILIKASVDPDAAHVGQKGDVFVVEWYGGKFTQLNSSGVWLPWSGSIAELQPVLDDVVLSATQEVTIYSGGITTEGEHRLYVGYLSSLASAPLIYSTSPAIFQFKAAVVDPLTYFQTQVFDNIVMTKCTLCHVDNGVANSSKLHFIKDASKSQQNYDIFSAFYKQQPDAYNYVLSKVSGGNGHLGGIQLPLGSTDYQTLAGFLDLLGGATSVATQSTQALFDGVTTQGAADTLRDASLLLAGRLPTAAETASVTSGGDTSLKQVLIALMQGANFHKFLKDSADDRLFLRGNEDTNPIGDCATCFPPLNAQYWSLKDKADLPGSPTAAFDRGVLNLWISQLNFSIAESPLELIAYVVENNKPYSEILTADYDMLTPVLNAVTGGTAVFPAGAAAVDFQPGRIQGYYLRDSGTVLVQVPGSALPRITTAPKLVVNYPHVGVLNSKSFLSRYPTTATNRNRARSRWTYYNFLGIDIEALAKRTADPVALADTNNPTMNNPACTVCHSVVDPVAGTFQDFSDNGIYKSSINGTDSLDRFYKTQTSPKLYVNGDIWYRDMRVPGFEGTTAAATNSLRWLADQIVKDKRFATATVRFWWPAVISAEVLKLPEATEDANYQAKLSAYEAQQSEISALTDKFVASGLSVKSLLADLVLSKWYRADKLDGNQVSSVQSSARTLADVTGEKLLTPEQLSRKTRALTGFNWNAQTDVTSAAIISGLENDYSTFYGGIDGFALKVRARTLTPLMSNVATTHALESSCPIVLGDFIRADDKRLLFAGLSPWTTPLTEQSGTRLMTSKSETDFQSFAMQADLQPGTRQIVVSLLNDACDYSTSASTCKADKNLVIDSLTIKQPNGQTTQLLGTAGTYANCAASTGSNRITLYSSCTATYPFAATASGLYTITVTAAARQQTTDPVLAGLNVESTVAATASTTAGATLIKNKLVELHAKLLGETVTVTSPEILSAYDLLVQTWLTRKSGSSAPSLLQKALACDWSSDISFISTLAYPGNPLQTNGKYNTTAVTNWLTPQAQDPLLMKQAWAVVMTYLLSHYDYLHE